MERQQNIEFSSHLDPCSFQIIRNGEVVGFLAFGDNKDQKITFLTPDGFISFSPEELIFIAKKGESEAEKRKEPKARISFI